MRDFRPHVVITYDEEGGYPHPDHIRTHVISVAAFDAAADPDMFPGAGDAWQPLKLYYHGGFSLRRLEAIDEAMLAHNGTSPFKAWIDRMRATRPSRPQREDHHPHRGHRLPRRPGRGPQGTRHPDRPERRALVRDPARGRGSGVGHGRLRTGPLAGGFAGPGG
jgi:LmbE family N-acetylglucosaminyl deacetylase